MSIESNIEIPTEVPVMTLRDVVLFPKAMMPLKIFEPRYREMLENSLQGNRMFAIVAERENVGPDETSEEPPFEVGTVGLVRVSKKHEDGTSFVLLQGLERVKINAIVREEPYRLIQVKPWPTRIDEKAEGVRDELSTELQRNYDLGGGVTEQMLEFLNPLEDDVSFVDLTIFSICEDTFRKQAMLEVQSLAKRGRMIIEDLILENKRLSLLREALGNSDNEQSDRN
tara:strand:- start:768 stop:1448 length:681 start_codon:yes stop_codon:yes gene_type:complete